MHPKPSGFTPISVLFSLAGLRGLSGSHHMSGSMPSSLWNFLTESSTLEVGVVIIPRLRGVKSLSQGHTAGGGFPAS